VVPSNGHDEAAKGESAGGPTGREKSGRVGKGESAGGVVTQSARRGGHRIERKQSTESGGREKRKILVGVRPCAGGGWYKGAEGKVIQFISRS